MVLAFGEVRSWVIGPPVRKGRRRILCDLGCRGHGLDPASLSIERNDIAADCERVGFCRFGRESKSHHAVARNVASNRKPSVDVRTPKYGAISVSPCLVIARNASGVGYLSEYVFRLA